MNSTMNNMTDDAVHHDDALAGHQDETAVLTSSKPWADIVGACLLINIVTLSGIVLTGVTRYCINRKHKSMIELLVVPSFAAGM